MVCCLGLIQNCVTVHLSKQLLGGSCDELVGRPSTNRREGGWQSDSQCTITLVFRFGLDPALLLDTTLPQCFCWFLFILCLLYSLPPTLLFLGAPSSGNTFLSCLTAVHCLDFPHCKQHCTPGPELP